MVGLLSALKMPVLQAANGFRSRTDRKEFVIVMSKLKGRYEKNRASYMVSEDGTRTHFMQAYTYVVSY